MDLLPPTPITRLPNELLDLIISHLPNRDIKSLRSTCSHLSVLPLRLQRVFLSPNPSNIKVFRRIADHDNFRRDVVEIIWDDALLRTSCDEDYDDEGFLGEYNQWMVRACKKNLQDLNSRKSNDVDRPDHIARALQAVAAMQPIKAFWGQYALLFREEMKVLKSNADVDALAYGLKRFPSLKRITITPATHGYLFNPLYETPMIRSFPYGFNYPIPYGWPKREDDTFDKDSDKEKHWRGCRVVMRLLAQETAHHVTELVITDHQLGRGIDCNIFRDPCEQYDNLVCLLRKPGFSRLDLSLAANAIDQEHHYGWSAFFNGSLRYALAQAMGLEHVSLSVALSYLEPGAKVGNQPIERCMSLNAIFPVENWPKLRHFGLSGFVVTTEDVVSLFKRLPETIRSVELRSLHFLGEDENWWKLLTAIRDELDWRTRGLATGPKLVICPDTYRDRWPGRAIWIEDEVSEFLYGDGPNPFSELGAVRFVGVERDVFDPEYERPHTTVSNLQRLGITKKDERPLCELEM
ncbi:hypothetical protein BO78DRAFT_438098 [Aspergillus sclerotiicarbonarius CBS 121057]|uniref:F-box domain-containing protein n=1 Tax=Aspergillus sclerotiicarbonarius (strain CBS 121057 / IBT 28362) TaxID=1448318 RepID=A0A319ERB1_ASPSB|nr:hypothetical protein BO78DRAFT_438098 [Aspergillus sclerotiicarbonarius CBS 121057]